MAKGGTGATTADTRSGVWIEYVPLSAVRAATRNPKEHDLGAIIQSIVRFGFVNPGVMNEATGHTVVGHGRADALSVMRREGYPVPDRVRVSEDGEWLIPVVRGVSFANDVEAEAYLVADNRLTELGGWDEPVLASVLTDLRDAGVLEYTGYDESDLNAINLRLSDDLPGGTDFEHLNNWGVIVVCSSEEHQQQVYNELLEHGYEHVQVVVS